MKKVIVFSDLFQKIDWFFNTEKQTFIHPYEANLSDPAFWVASLEIPDWISEIALDEFRCSEDYLSEYGLGIREINTSIL
jgi:hypothetical protein